MKHSLDIEDGVDASSEKIGLVIYIAKENLSYFEKNNIPFQLICVIGVLNELK